MHELVPRAEQLRQIAGLGPDDSEGFSKWSLKFALSHPAVSTVIAGARTPQQAERNCAASDGVPVNSEQAATARKLWKEDPYLRALRTGL
jgi:aryl-alcohol dehydrogenase-like predicted oxidoreductase